MGLFFWEMYIYVSPESFPLTYDLLGQGNIWLRYNHLKSEGAKKKSKCVQIKFLAMHFTNQSSSFEIFTVWNLQNIFTELDLYLIY